jgi:hypothetical protein
MRVVLLVVCLLGWEKGWGGLTFPFQSLPNNASGLFWEVKTAEGCFAPPVRPDGGP